MKNILLSGITFQPIHHDTSTLRGCHNRKKTKQWNIVCAFTHGWLDTGGEPTNPTFSQGLGHRTGSQIRREKASSKQD